LTRESQQQQQIKAPDLKTKKNLRKKRAIDEPAKNREDTSTDHASPSFAHKRHFGGDDANHGFTCDVLDWTSKYQLLAYGWCLHR